MDQHDALYKIARKYPGGISALAHRMGLTEAVLYNKIRPAIHTHYLSFEEVSEIIEYCQGANVPDATLPLMALTWRHGLIAIPAPDPDQATTDEQLAKNLCGVMKEIGDVAAFLNDKLATSGRLHVTDVDQFEREFREAFGALAQLYARAEAHFKIKA